MPSWDRVKGRFAFLALPAHCGYNSHMTYLLERAINEVSQLPDSEQDALASILLEEIVSEARWGAAFANPQPQLACLAANALAEFHAGRTLPLDPEHDLADH
jgi:hypothetical protein